MGRYRLALGTRIVEALDSRVKTAALAVAVGMMFGSVEFFIPSNKHFFFHFVATAFGGAAITYVLLTGARARRLAVLEHIRKVAELNHNVRNALDVILSTHYLSAALAEQDRKVVMSSIERIDRTLNHLFPVIGERRSDRSGRPDLRTQGSLPDCCDSAGKASVASLSSLRRRPDD
jgi:hypothetical protein